MGLCLSTQKQPDLKQKPQKSKVDTKSKIQSVDVVKVKLKQARDNIKNFIKKKEKDLYQINLKIKQQVPNYQQTGNKKKIIPLLKAKKDLQTMIDTADTRLKLVNEKLSEVQLQQMDVDTINVLDDSNQYIKSVQQVLEKKDWRAVLDQAKNKVQLDWGQKQDIQQDEDFKAMWKQLGGDKIPAKKSVNVNVEVNTNKNTNLNQKERQKALA